MLTPPHCHFFALPFSMGVLGWLCHLEGYPKITGQGHTVVCGTLRNKNSRGKVYVRHVYYRNIYIIIIITRSLSSWHSGSSAWLDSSISNASTTITGNAARRMEFIRYKYLCMYWLHVLLQAGRPEKSFFFGPHLSRDY